VSRQPPSPELLHERTLAERFAVLKLILAILNFLVIGLDTGIPGTDTPFATAMAIVVAGGFLVYMTICWMAIRAGWLSMRVYRRIIPLTDVLAASMLILATEGYLSPFNLWLAITVVAAGFGSAGSVPILTAIAAIIAQIIIATIPQRLPLEPGGFFVRTAYLFGVALLVASISSHLIRQSKSLQAIAKFGHDLALVSSGEAAQQLFRDSLRDELDADEVDLILGEAPNGWTEITSGDVPIGGCRIVRDGPLTPQERQLMAVFADRLHAALKRLELGDELIESAAREERQRYADELHDTHLQTLAAVDMQAEAVSRILKGGPASEEIKAIKTTVREAAARTREFIATIDEQPQGGPAVLRQVIDERWPDAEVHLDDEMDLTEGQWRAVTMLLQEGINNARMHGKGDRLRFTLGHEGSRILASLESNGRSPAEDVIYGYGLARLRTVVQANKGEMTFLARPEGGSLLQASFPRKPI
jgi:signal transduction histidine kinase